LLDAWQKKEKRMPRYFTPISEDELKGKIEAAWKIRNPKSTTMSPNIVALTPTVEADLKKVDFDCENIAWDAKSAFKNKLDTLLGYQTLDNGFTFHGFMAGGDWEVPLFFLIYWDGKRLRAYIPTEGNAWNTSSKSAYGNAESREDGDGTSDRDNLYIRLGQQVPVEEDEEEEDCLGDYEIFYDPQKIIDDIKARILPRP
jgi:hypothetical protein